MRKLVDFDDPGGVGREIVREIRVCPPCKQALQSGSGSAES